MGNSTRSARSAGVGPSTRSVAPSSSSPVHHISSGYSNGVHTTMGDSAKVDSGRGSAQCVSTWYGAQCSQKFTQKGLFVPGRGSNYVSVLEKFIHDPVERAKGLDGLRAPYIPKSNARKRIPVSAISVPDSA
eukprot:1703817-Rhodomonas_salina.3